MSKRILTFLAVALPMGLAAGSGEVTVSRCICMEPSASLLWKTVTSPDRSAVLDWPEGATHAVVTVTTSAGEVRTVPIADPTVTTCSLAFELPTADADERTVDVAVSYLDADENELRADTATLGLVQGTGTETTIPVRTADSPKWRKLKSAAVLPISVDATALTVDGDAVSPLDAPGWRYWDPELGLHELTLTTDAGDLPATVERLGGGLLLLFR